MYINKILCRSQPGDNVDVIGECGPDGEGTLMRIGFQVIG